MCVAKIYLLDCEFSCKLDSSCQESFSLDSSGSLGSHRDRVTSVSIPQMPEEWGSGRRRYSLLIMLWAPGRALFLFESCRSTHES